MTMTRQDTATATPSAELERVEHAFSETGFLLDEPMRRCARERAAEALAALGSPDKTARDAELLLLARALLSCGPSMTEPRQLAQLVDRLAADLAVTRARVARALLAAEGAGESEESTAQALLALLEAADRRLTRLGFDLHDGPLQELLLLGEDMRMFRGQLSSVLGERDEAPLLSGRLEDLEARAAELERGLRQISTAAGARIATDRPFAESVRELTDAFAARTGIAPLVRLDGGSASMSPSQRIALLSVIGEALNNVREHGRTVSTVEVAIELGSDGVGARVSDDGCGFDVEAALLDAAQRGRIGLAGIYERVRLLDGECVVESRPGGPTTVSLKLPRWELPGGSAVMASRA
jgi:signal transduction histidine kinase